MASSSGSSFLMRSFVTLRPSSSTPLGLLIHCQICEREISAVAASSIRLKTGTQPLPASHEPRYWMPTLMLLRRPASVIGFSGWKSSRSRAVTFDVVALPVDLVRRRHVLVEHRLRDLDQAGVRDPGAVAAVGRLAHLVRAHLLHRRLVRRAIVLDRDLRRHAAHRERIAPVAGLDQQQAYARMNGAVMVTCARSARQKSGLDRNFLMQLKM